MNTPEQLSESLLAACKAAGIENPRYIAQDKCGLIYHYNKMPHLITRNVWGSNNGSAKKINHAAYTSDWKDSLMEWVDHIADTSKKINDAIRIGYHAHLENGDGLCWSRAGDYRAGWQDALAWKGSSDD